MFCEYVLVYLHDTKSVKKLRSIVASSNFSFITSQPEEDIIINTKELSMEEFNICSSY